MLNGHINYTTRGTLKTADFDWHTADIRSFRDLVRIVTNYIYFQSYFSAHNKRTQDVMALSNFLIFDVDNPIDKATLDNSTARDLTKASLHEYLNKEKLNHLIISTKSDGKPKEKLVVCAQIPQELKSKVSHYPVVTDEKGRSCIAIHKTTERFRVFLQLDNPPPPEIFKDNHIWGAYIDSFIEKYPPLAYTDFSATKKVAQGYYASPRTSEVLYNERGENIKASEHAKTAIKLLRQRHQEQAIKLPSSGVYSHHLMHLGDPNTKSQTLGHLLYKRINSRAINMQIDILEVIKRYEQIEKITPINGGAYLQIETIHQKGDSKYLTQQNNRIHDLKPHKMLPASVGVVDLLMFYHDANFREVAELANQIDGGYYYEDVDTNQIKTAALQLLDAPDGPKCFQEWYNAVSYAFGIPLSDMSATKDSLCLKGVWVQFTHYERTLVIAKLEFNKNYRFNFALRSEKGEKRI